MERVDTPLITGVDHNRRVVSVVPIGTVTVADVPDHVQHVIREHGIDYPELWDAGGAAFAPTAEDFQQILEMVRALPKERPPGWTAAIVFSIADLDSRRALDARLEALREVRAFVDEHAARLWLSTSARSRSA